MKPSRFSPLLLALLTLAGCGGSGQPGPLTAPPPAGSYVGTWASRGGDLAGTLSVAFSEDGHAYGTGTTNDSGEPRPVSVYGDRSGAYRMLLIGDGVLGSQWEKGTFTLASDGHIHAIYSQNRGDGWDTIRVDLAPGGDNVVPNPPPGTAIPQGHFTGIYRRNWERDDTLDLTVAPDGRVNGTVTGDDRGEGTIAGTITATGALSWTIAFPGETHQTTSNIFTVFIDRLIGVVGETNDVVVIDVRRQPE